MSDVDQRTLRAHALFLAVLHCAGDHHDDGQVAVKSSSWWQTDLGRVCVRALVAAPV